MMQGYRCGYKHDAYIFEMHTTRKEFSSWRSEITLGQEAKK